jgi:hypothetical protein
MPAAESPPVARIAAGQILHRVHGAVNSARWYGRRNAAWRWDDPDRSYGVLYLGRNLAGPFVEALLRTPADPDVLWEAVEQKRAASFVTTRSLRLAPVHGPGLAWFRTTTAAVTADFDPTLPGAAYAMSQRISARVHAETKLDGIQYRSRFDSDELLHRPVRASGRCNHTQGRR